MTPTDRPDELIQRYLYAVSARLPRTGRDDIIRELRTLIDDKLDEHPHGPTPAAAADVTAAILQDIGEPGVVAARYHARPQYLIGPRTYPTLVRLTKLGLLLAVVVVMLTTGLSQAAFGNAVPGFGWAVLAHMAAGVFQISIALFGGAVIALAVIERTHREAGHAKDGWDPRRLPPIPEAEEERINAPWLALEIALVAFILVIANFFPQWIGVLVVRNGGPSGIVPLTDLGIQLPMVLVNLWLAVALAHKFLVLGQRRWTPLSRWLAVMVGLLATLVTAVIAYGSPLHAPPSLAQLDPALHALQTLLYLAPVAVFIQPVLRIIRLVRGRPAHLEEQPGAA